MQSLKSASALLYAAVMVIFSGWIMGCKKSNENSNNEPHYTLEPNGLNYIRIPAGKYFIYKDSATLKLDSVVVTESVLDNLHTTNQSAFGQFYYQKYTLRLTKIDTVNSRWLSGEATAMFNSNQFLMIATWAPNSYEVGHLFRYPLGIYQATVGMHDSLLTTMNVESKTYNNVIRTTQNDTHGSTYYWAKGIGIIKYIKGGSTFTTYTLIRNG